MPKVRLGGLALLFAVVFEASSGLAQFDWNHSSIGGGGFCLEIRFSPVTNGVGLFGRSVDQSLYLATDVAGVYRSVTMDSDGEVTEWEMLRSPQITVENDIPDRYATTIGFTTEFQGGGAQIESSWVPRKESICGMIANGAPYHRCRIGTRLRAANKGP